MTALVRIALSRPYTFVVLALLILIIGPLAALRTPTAQARGTRSFSRTPAKTRAAATVSAKGPLHPAAATLAQLKDRNRSLNR